MKEGTGLKFPSERADIAQESVLSSGPIPLPIANSKTAEMELT